MKIKRCDRCDDWVVKVQSDIVPMIGFCGVIQQNTAAGNFCHIEQKKETQGQAESRPVIEKHQ